MFVPGRVQLGHVQVHVADDHHLVEELLLLLDVGAEELQLLLLEGMALAALAVLELSIDADQKQRATVRERGRDGDGVELLEGGSAVSPVDALTRAMDLALLSLPQQKSL